MAMDSGEPWEVDLLRQFCATQLSLEEVSERREEWRSCVVDSWFLSKALCCLIRDMLRDSKKTRMCRKREGGGGAGGRETGGDYV